MAKSKVAVLKCKPETILGDVERVCELGGMKQALAQGRTTILKDNISWHFPFPSANTTPWQLEGSIVGLRKAGFSDLVCVQNKTVVTDAFKGEDKFKNNKIALRTLMVLYPNRMHVVSIEGIGIEKMADLKGKRVSTGSPGSATEVMAFRVIEASGLDKDKDMTRERLGVAESVNAIKDRKIDAFFWVGGLPTAAVTDLANTPGVKIRMIDHGDTVDKMNRKFGQLYVHDSIPKAMYRGMDADNKIATVWNILVSNENLSDKTAYAIVKTIFDHKADLVAVHKESENFTLENQKASASPIPYHPGAIRYFAERGVKLN